MAGNGGLPEVVILGPSFLSGSYSIPWKQDDDVDVPACTFSIRITDPKVEGGEKKTLKFKVHIENKHPNCKTTMVFPWGDPFVVVAGERQLSAKVLHCDGQTSEESKAELSFSTDFTLDDIDKGIPEVKKGAKTYGIIITAKGNIIDKTGRTKCACTRTAYAVLTDNFGKVTGTQMELDITNVKCQTFAKGGPYWVSFTASIKNGPPSTRIAVGSTGALYQAYKFGGHSASDVWVSVGMKSQDAVITTDAAGGATFERKFELTEAESFGSKEFKDRFAEYRKQHPESTPTVSGRKWVLRILATATGDQASLGAQLEMHVICNPKKK
ncbi:MAG TPA: hypothetical protein VFC90_13725 [Planctomycetota bacterium]|nr:hypothetical protein [Planctomycetota bacterium]